MHRSDDDVKVVALVLTAGMVMFALLGALSYFSYQECTRVHPAWYCMFD